MKKKKRFSYNFVCVVAAVKCTFEAHNISFISVFEFGYCGVCCSSASVIFHDFGLLLLRMRTANIIQTLCEKNCAALAVVCAENATIL